MSSSSNWWWGVVVLASAVTQAQSTDDAPRGADSTKSTIREQAARAARAAQDRARHTTVDVTLPTKQEDEAKIRALAEQARASGIDELRRQSEQYREARPNLPIPGGGMSSEEAGAQAIGGTLVVALSSSMPDADIRQYFTQLDGLPGSVVVLRGFIGGAQTVAPTGRWIEGLARRNGSDRGQGYFGLSIKVDPLLYRDLKINRVPAVAFLPGITDLKHCDNETLSAASVVYGSSTVLGALQELKRQGVAVPDALFKRVEGRP